MQEIAGVCNKAEMYIPVEMLVSKAAPRQRSQILAGIDSVCSLKWAGGERVLGKLFVTAEDGLDADEFVSLFKVTTT
jgi:hypothetical protein